jgi:hypothetical protein
MTTPTRELGRLLAGSALLGAVLVGCSDNPAVTDNPPTTYVQDWQYLASRYFFLTDPDGESPVVLDELFVFLDDRNPIDDVDLGALPGRAWLDPAQRTPAYGYLGMFHLLQQDIDYEVDTFGPDGLPYLRLRAPMSLEGVLAVAYSGEVNGDSVEVGTRYGSWASGDTLELKMLRPGSEDWGTVDLTLSPWAPARRLELKNIYSLGMNRIDPVSLHVRIVRDVAGPGGDNPPTLLNEFGVTTPLLEVLGLDQVDNAHPSDLVPDGEVDSRYIDYENGLLFFPDLRPFDPGLADISGTAHRERSWPEIPTAGRPDTLGWYLGPGAVPTPSTSAVREMETVPAIYDTRLDALALTHEDVHVYTLEVTLDEAP